MFLITIFTIIARVFNPGLVSVNYLLKYLFNVLIVGEHLLVWNLISYFYSFENELIQHKFAPKLYIFTHVDQRQKKMKIKNSG